MHAMKFVAYLNERGGRVILKEIEAPEIAWESPATVFQAALEHEYKVTGLINDLVDLALAEKDHATHGFLQWFVEEQVEEEATFQEIVDKFDLGKDHPGFLYLLDKELGQRQPAASRR